MKRECIFSPCRKYRYTLWREWGNDASQLWNGENEMALKPPGSFVQFIGLNPSTADETNDDPTIRRCIGFAKSWGYGAFCMTNIFAFRATDPNVMKREQDPVGMGNDTHILNCAKEAGIIVAGWGNHGEHNDRSNWVRKMFFDCGLKLHHLGLTSTNQPKHPLYLRADTKPTLWV